MAETTTTTTTTTETKEETKKQLTPKQIFAIKFQKFNLVVGVW